MGKSQTEGRAGREEGRKGGEEGEMAMVASRDPGSKQTRNMAEEEL
jgi:hypothetical protein